MIALTGLRCGRRSGCGGAWDLDQALLHVREQVVAVATEVRIGPPTTKAGERSVALSNATVAMLREH